MLYVITFNNKGQGSYFIGVADNQLKAIEIMNEDIAANGGGTCPNNYAITTVMPNTLWTFNIAEAVAEQYDADGGEVDEV